MGLVYMYMAAWIAGGVLLGSNLLLEHPTEPRLAAHDELNQVPLGTDSGGPQRARSSALHMVALALIGFGLGGLVAEGVALVSGPWTCAVAVTAAALLGAGGYLSRSAKPQ
jgi:hypothetical protein